MAGLLLHPHRLAAPGGGGGFALDAVQSIVLAGYSYRRQLFSSYAGALWTLQRTSDNATRDPPVVEGALDESTMLTWILAAGNAYGKAITSLPDQSGNGNNAEVMGTNIRVRGDSGLHYGFAADGSSEFRVPAALYSGKTSGAVFMLVKAGDTTIFRVTADGGTPFQPYGDGNCYSSFLSTSRPNIGTYGSTSSATARLHAEEQTGTHLKVFRDNVQKGSTTAATFSTTLTQRVFGASITVIEAIFLSRVPTTEERDLIAGDMMAA